VFIPGFYRYSGRLKQSALLLVFLLM